MSLKFLLDSLTGSGSVRRANRRQLIAIQIQHVGAVLKLNRHRYDLNTDCRVPPMWRNSLSGPLSRLEASTRKPGALLNPVAARHHPERAGNVHHAGAPHVHIILRGEQ